MFTAKNLRLLGLSVALLVVGFVLLGRGPIDNPVSETVAPLVLVFVYCILLPMTIMAREKNDDNDDTEKGKGV